MIRRIFDAIHNFNILTTNSAVEAVWQNYYNGVFACNVVLDGLATGGHGVSDAARTEDMAEVQFLRAYYYFVLTTCYGKIPLHLAAESGVAAQRPVSSQDSDLYADRERLYCGGGGSAGYGNGGSAGAGFEGSGVGAVGQDLFVSQHAG